MLMQHPYRDSFWKDGDLQPNRAFLNQGRSLRRTDLDSLLERFVVDTPGDQHVFNPVECVGPVKNTLLLTTMKPSR